MTSRIEEEVALLRTAYPDLEYRLAGEAHWIRLPSYPVPEGWSVAEVEIAFEIPPSAGQAPYAFRVRPGIQRDDGAEIQNYAYPVTTPWGDDWGQFSWSPTTWIPKDEIRAGANMLNFARSFTERLEEGA